MNSRSDFEKVINTEGVSLEEQEKLQKNIQEHIKLSQAQIRSLGVSQEPNLGTISE